MDKKTAEANLEKAIDDYVTAVEGEPSGLLVDWLLVTAHHQDHGDRGTATVQAVYVPHHQRLYQAAGLIVYADTKIKQRM